MWVIGPRTIAVPRLTAVALCAALAGCSTFPATAPTTTELVESLDDGDQTYLMVDVDERVASILHQYRRPGFGARFKQRRYVPNNRLHAGDVVGISVYEVGGASLFGTAPAGPAPDATGAPQTSVLSGVATTIPPQVVEADGTIMVPYVGRIRAVNRTPGQLGDEIQKQLEGKAVEPQVLVTLISSTNTATVGGDVGQPRAVPLTLRGERLLDVIAAAGGARYPAYEVYVSVTRDGHMETVLLQHIVTNASENILVRPNDQIFLTRHPRTFAVLGATNNVSQYTFDTPKVTLAEAVARAGGPIDTVGNPSGIFLFRYEPVEMATRILGDPEKVSAKGAVTIGPDREFVPILYRIDFRKAGGLFTAQDIAVHDKDVVLVTNAEAVQLTKVLVVIRGFTGIAFDLTRQGN